MEVLELSKAPLDATLFDVPAGYREVKNALELGSKAGAVRVGLVNASDKTGRFQSGSINGRVMTLLKSENVVTIPFSPGGASDIEAQAKAAQCDSSYTRRWRS